MSGGELTVQNKIDAIHKELGAVGGVQKEQGRALDKMQESLTILVQNSAKMDQLTVTSVQHDKRIGELEQKATVHELKLKQHGEHIENDVSVDSYIERASKKILLALAGAVGYWLCSKLPHIIEALNDIP